ncbi:hypothetical protein [Chromobacterium vaccinii]|uniref:hypothetical protein n=1 Tax=Chromobacterium vaccinii TaxID=1108595 RepID=UPI000AD61C29|nr:hypothetical protein [Chromobacterium vaccinii]
MKKKDQVIFDAVATLGFIDTILYRLGTSLGERDASIETIQRELFNTFSTLDIGNSISDIQSSLRELIEDSLIYDENNMSKLDYIIQEKVNKYTPHKEE